MITLQSPRDMDGRARAGVRVGLSASELGRFLRAAQRAVGLEGEVHVLLADDRTLRRLNRTFLGKDKATDVLSFPAAATTVFFGDPKGPGLAGDLAISLDRATRQAARFGHTLSDEVRVLLLHGLLHLAGFDHERDTGEMATREMELRQKLGLPAGLIARTGSSAGPGKSKPRRNAGVLRCAQGDNSKSRPQVLRLRAAHSAQDDKLKGKIAGGRVRA